MGVIDFIVPAVLASDGGVSCRVRVVGKYVACKFSADWSEDVDLTLITDAPMIQLDTHLSRLLDI